ncbi:hypothetical protein NVS89_10085 [Ancylobacter sp. MQZ15Z-1]|uniref:Uncharacterized protein n=1 Tax=Ancylobacter mangrovi TaxID=2972472 RepID=A0A9X2PAX8_9HYPH|nr:hypothetical protein [Ancylobacter mangrovi]MCS0495447.1 hypothetical protein [Ancylobacter mangrovi]
MVRIVNVVLRSSVYLAGAATGVVVALPLMAASFGAVAASRAVPPVVAIGEMGPHEPVYQASMVNRAAKGPRLDIGIPTASTAGEGAPVAIPVGATTFAPPVVPATAPGTMTPADATPSAIPASTIPASSIPGAPGPTRAMETPRGCLSSLGVTKSNLATEEMTVCVADASLIN